MKAARRFQADFEPLEGRRLLSSVPYHPVAVVGKGVAVQTSNIAQSGGGMQVVDMLAGRASDLGPFSGAILYTTKANGTLVSGMGALYGLHKYELAFILSGAVTKASPSATTADVNLRFDVVGGTKKFELASGNGYISGVENLKTHRIAFQIKINGRVNQLT